MDEVSKLKINAGRVDDKNRTAKSSEQAEFQPILKGKRIYLREVRLSDVNENYYRWMNDPEITEYLETRYVPQSRENIAEYVRKMDGNANEPFFAICTIDGDEHIGNIKLGPIDWKHRRADVSQIIGEKRYWSSGYGAEAKALVAKFAFEVLGLNKIGGGVYEKHIGALKSTLKCGWKQEGLLRDHIIDKGEPVGLILVGMTAKDYWKKTNE